MRQRALLFIIPAIILAGCTVISQDIEFDSASLLQSQASLRFSDIPVPAGFNLILDESFAFESSGLRVGMLKYYGKAGLDELTEFYKSQMPLSGWSLLNVAGYSERVLNFERKAEICTISLLPRFNLINWNYILITISLGPKSQKNFQAEKKALDKK